MKSTARRVSGSIRTAVVIAGLMSAATAHADVRVTHDWGTGMTPDGMPLPKHLDDNAQMKAAATEGAQARNAVPPGDRGRAELGLGYKLFIDDKKYYLQPALFMAKQHAGDICTPADYNNVPTYQCVEGHRYRKGCHVFVIDEAFREVGFHTIEVKESAPYFCNAVPAVGVGDKTRNEVLVTVQYFFIDRKPAAKMSEIGNGWKRMTVPLRLKAEGGKVLIEQDDRCLGNPNTIDTIPDARRRLKQCAQKPS